MTRGHVTYDTDSRIKCYEPPVTISNGVEQVRDVRKYAGCQAVWAVTAGNVTAGKQQPHLWVRLQCRFILG